MLFAKILLAIFVSLIVGYLVNMGLYELNEVVQFSTFNGVAFWSIKQANTTIVVAWFISFLGFAWLNRTLNKPKSDPWTNPEKSDLDKAIDGK